MSKQKHQDRPKYASTKPLTWRLLDDIYAEEAKGLVNLAATAEAQLGFVRSTHQAFVDDAEISTVEKAIAKDVDLATDELVAIKQKHKDKKGIVHKHEKAMAENIYFEYLGWSQKFQNGVVENSTKLIDAVERVNSTLATPEEVSQ